MKWKKWLIDGCAFCAVVGIPLLAMLALSWLTGPPLPPNVPRICLSATNGGIQLELTDTNSGASLTFFAPTRKSL